MKIEGVWKKVFSIAAFFVLAGVGCIMPEWLHASTHVADKSLPASGTVSEKLPFQETILPLIEPLQYSAVPAMLDPEVILEVDFSKQTWTLKNFRHYNEKGELFLADGRYGLCAELVTYVYQHLKPSLGKQYSLEFARTTEPDFFNTSQSNHIILVISDQLRGEIFMLDPSFHRYGRPGAFPGYVIHSAKDVLGAFQKNDRDVTYHIGDTMPLLIRDGSLLVFSVEPIRGVLDRQNVVLAISARQRQSASGRYLFALRKQAGEVEALREEPVFEHLLSPEERAQIAQKLFSWMQSL